MRFYSWCNSFYWFRLKLLIPCVMRVSQLWMKFRHVSVPLLLGIKMSVKENEFSSLRVQNTKCFHTMNSFKQFSESNRFKCFRVFSVVALSSSFSFPAGRQKLKQRFQVCSDPQTWTVFIYRLLLVSDPFQHFLFSICQIAAVFLLICLF